MTSASAAVQDLRGVQVLVVDDEPDALALVADVLEAARARVRTASSAQEALQHLNADVPDVVVADLGMPHVDGVQSLTASGDITVSASERSQPRR
jgi:CheY-like chemotaxis protein